MEPPDRLGATANVQLTPSFGQFSATTYPRLVVVCHALLGDRAEAERAASEALVRVRRNWSELELADDADRQVRVLALRRATRRWLRRRRVARHGDSASEASGGRTPLPDAALWNAVAQLPRRQRWIVVLHYVDEQPLASAAAIVGASPDTMTIEFSNAIARLYELLGDSAGEPLPPRPSEPDDTQTTAEVDLGLAEPVEERQRRDDLDARLRASVEAMWTTQPGERETTDALRDLLVPPERRRGLAIVSVAAATIVLAVPLFVWLGGDSGGDSAGPSSSVADEDQTVLAAPTSPPTTVEQDDDEEEDDGDGDSSNELVTIEPADRDLTAQYDPASGYLLTSAERGWDGDRGVCVGVSRFPREPAPEDLVVPDAVAGCVPGNRRGIPLIMWIDNATVELTLTTLRAQPWRLNTEQPQSSHFPRCVPKEVRESLAPGQLYEVACRASRPQIRHFDSTTTGDRVIISTPGRDPIVAERVANGDDLQMRGAPNDSTGPGVEVFRVEAGSPAGNSAPCALVVVPEVAGWREACTELDGRGVLGFAERDDPYLIRYHDEDLEVLRGDSYMDASALGCEGTLSDVLSVSDTLGMWIAFGCEGITGTGVRPATSISRPPDDPRHDVAEIWIGEDRGRAVFSESGRPTSSFWAETWRRPDTDEAWRCGDLAPCGGATVVPLLGSSYIWAPGISYENITLEARAAAGDATDPGGIGVRIFDELVGIGETSGPENGAYTLVDGTTYRLRGHDYRWVTAQRWADPTGQPTVTIGAWTVRLAGSEDWSVAVAYRGTLCTPGPKSSCTE